MDMILKGYQDANLKAEQDQKSMQTELAQSKKDLAAAKKQVHELEIKAMVQKDEVYIEKKTDDVDMVTQNILGQQNTMTQQQLKQERENMRKLIQENHDLKTEWTVKETQLVGQQESLREQIKNVERKLYDTEFVVQERNSHIAKLKDLHIADR